MKNQSIHTALAFAGLISGLSADLSEDLSKQKMIFAASPGVAWTAEWQGLANVTSFMQWSSELVQWSYFPAIEFHEGIKTQGGLNPAPRFFFRLKCTDDPTTNPELEDFDADSIGSLTELLIGHDPLVAEPFVDSDGDLIADAIEMHWYQNLTSMTSTSDADLDGIPDVFEVQAGGNPTLDESANTEERTTYLYDAMGRLTNADGETGSHAFGFDIEGNLESATVTNP